MIDMYLSCVFSPLNISNLSTSTIHQPPSDNPKYSTSYDPGRSPHRELDCRLFKKIVLCQLRIACQCRRDVICLTTSARSMKINVKELIASYDPNRPLAAASTPPSSWYTDPRIFELEQHRILPRAWQFAGRADQVRDPGQYITCDIAGEPILVVRGNDASCAASSTSAATTPRLSDEVRRQSRKSSLPLSRLDLRSRRRTDPHAGVCRRRQLRPQRQRPRSHSDC